MNPLGTPSGNKSTSCSDVTARCVIWDGPDIDIRCIGVKICKGDNITPILYNSYKNLCNLIQALDLTGLDANCLSDSISEHDNILDIFNTIAKRLCQEDVQVTKLEDIIESTYFATLPYCFQEVTDKLTVTKFPLADAYVKIASRICEYLIDIQVLQDQIEEAQDQLGPLQSEIDALCLITDPVVTPTCTNDPVLNPSVDPVRVELAYDWLEAAFCSFKNFTGTPSELNAAIAKDCPNIDNLPRLSNTGLMENIKGWTTSPTNVGDSFGNLWLTVCDLRSAIRNLQLTCCVDTPCLSMILGYHLEFDPNDTYVDVVFDSCTIKSLSRMFTYNSLGGLPPSWIGVDFPTIGNVSITVFDGNVNQTQDTGLTMVDLMQGPSYPFGNFYRYTYPPGFNAAATFKTININFTYKWVGSQYSINNIVPTGSNYTITAPNHDFQAGQAITITGVTPSGFNGSNLTVLGVNGNDLTVQSVTPGLTYGFGGAVSLYNPACEDCNCCCTVDITNGLY